jgi:hypothetical protein
MYFSDIFIAKLWKETYGMTLSTGEELSSETKESPS